MSSAAAQPDMRARLHEVPHKPGVYLMRDRFNSVIYVGKARDLRKRLAQYFTPARSRLADLKTRALLDSVWDFTIHVVRSDAEAVLLEGRLIKEYRPKYNISFRDDKNFLQLKVNLEDPFPRFQLVRVKKNDGARYYGPYAHSGALRATIEVLKRKFGLRSCRPRLPGEKDYRHCHDDIIKNCSAPCVGKIGEEEYRDRVLQACAFLEGRSKEIPAELEQEMQAAAARQDFEKAAALRDFIAALRRTSARSRRFLRGDALPSARDPQGDLAALGEVLGLPRPPALMECFDISNITDTHVVASMVRFKDGIPDRSSYRRFRINSVKGQDDFASMAEVVRRRYARLLAAAREAHPEAAEFSQEEPGEAVARLDLPAAAQIPDLIVVDGGRGQLSSACGELRCLGLRRQHIIGLAKEREEIYFPNDPQPLRLPHDSGALQLLQRIRDEAHRVANGYHQLLMKRRISESMLDDIDGINKARKQALLRVFGSVERLRQAAEEDIARVPGVGERLARSIKAALVRERKKG
ncbi:MAG: excinuclease ABC subunit UvrC [Chthoniobacterales bacterium]